jgi:hypothetical protein
MGFDVEPIRYAPPPDGTTKITSLFATLFPYFRHFFRISDIAEVTPLAHA